MDDLVGGLGRPERGLPQGGREKVDAADAFWDAPPSPLLGEEAGAESGGEAWGAHGAAEMVPAFSIVSESSGRWGKAERTCFLKASAELASRMLPIGMSPNSFGDRKAVHPAEFPMLTPPLAWSKSDDEEDQPVGGCFHHATKLVRTHFGHGKRQLRRTSRGQV